MIASGEKNMTTLISFLGTGQKGKGYEATNYTLNDQEFPEKYISISLTKAIKPKKLILLGTAGSVWDVFFEEGIDDLENEWLVLSEKVASQSVTQDDLQPFESYLSHKFNIEVHCILISFARDTHEQTDILLKLEKNLEDGEKVVLDVTHGFRHLPMLALVAARFLKQVKQIDVKHIYYGAFDMQQNNKCPILNLDGMLNMLDWVDALSTFDKDGDYSPFAPLLTKEGLSENDAEQLRQAAYFERTTNSSRASQKLNTVFKSLEKLDSPLFNLFKPQLTKRLVWFKKKNRGLREQRLAKEYLQRKDYLRAAIFTIEGIISEYLHKDKNNENNYDLRKEKSDLLAKENSQFSTLRCLRNTLAHGNRNNNRNINRVINNENELQKKLKSIF